MDYKELIDLFARGILNKEMLIKELYKYIGGQKDEKTGRERDNKTNI